MVGRNHGGADGLGQPAPTAGPLATSRGCIRRGGRRLGPLCPEAAGSLVAAGGRRELDSAGGRKRTGLALADGEHASRCLELWGGRDVPDGQRAWSCGKHVAGGAIRQPLERYPFRLFLLTGSGPLLPGGTSSLHGPHGILHSVSGHFGLVSRLSVRLFWTFATPKPPRRWHDGSPWMDLNAIIIGNYDNLLFIALVPAAIGVLVRYRNGALRTDTFCMAGGTLAAALLYTYPEGLALTSVLLTPLGVVSIWRLRTERHVWVGYIVASLLVLLLVSPYLPVSVSFLQHQTLSRSCQ